MRANDIQHGGSHYQTEYQHWDWAIDLELGYLESASTKYLSRWRKKNGLEDIVKAVHYMEKAAEANNEDRYHNTALSNPDLQMPSELEQSTLHTQRFLESYDIVGLEAACIWAVAQWHDYLSAKYAVGLLQMVRNTVEQGDDPRAVSYWPGLRQASTAGFTAALRGQQGSGPAAAAPSGSTNARLYTWELEVGKWYRILAHNKGLNPVENGGTWEIVSTQFGQVLGRNSSHERDSRGIPLAPNALWEEVQAPSDRASNWDFHHGFKQPPEGED